MTIAYKFLAKMILARLYSLLPEIIHETQTKFVQDHSILTSKWSQHTRQLMVILLLEFEKAYDE